MSTKLSYDPNKEIELPDFPDINTDVLPYFNVTNTTNNINYMDLNNTVVNTIKTGFYSIANIVATALGFPSYGLLLHIAWTEVAGRQILYVSGNDVVWERFTNTGTWSKWTKITDNKNVPFINANETQADINYADFNNTTPNTIPLGVYGISSAVRNALGWGGGVTGTLFHLPYSSAHGRQLMFNQLHANTIYSRACENNVWSEWKLVVNGNLTTSVPDPSTTMARDANGRAEIEDPLYSKQIVNKQYADALGTNAPTALTIVRRNVNANFSAATPTADNHVTTKEYVDSNKAPKPQGTSGVGQLTGFGGVGSASPALPSGGTWGYFIFGTNSTGKVVGKSSGVQSGGQIITVSSAVDTFGWCWRIG
jgi:hypothetical protein